MNKIFGLAAMMLPTFSWASAVTPDRCFKTNLTTPVVSVCEARIDGAPGFTILLMSGENLVYKTVGVRTVGDDPVFRTTKFENQLSLAGRMGPQSTVIPANDAQPEMKIYAGYRTNTKDLVYLTSLPGPLEFLIDLRR